MFPTIELTILHLPKVFMKYCVPYFRIVLNAGRNHCKHLRTHLDALSNCAIRPVGARLMMRNVPSENFPLPAALLCSSGRILTSGCLCYRYRNELIAASETKGPKVTYRETLLTEYIVRWFLLFCVTFGKVPHQCDDYGRMSACHSHIEAIVIWQTDVSRSGVWLSVFLDVLLIRL